MSNLERYAERELRAAGWFDKESDYGGLVGEAVFKMVRAFAEEGHSGSSAELVLTLFNRVTRFQPLGSLRHPLVTGEYMRVDGSMGSVMQSTRKHSLFSNDNGKTWYDIDKRPVWWKRIFGIRRAYVRFAA